MKKTPRILDPIIRYQMEADITELERLLRVTKRRLNDTSLTYGQLVKTGVRLENKVTNWRELELDSEIIEHDVAR